MGINGIMNHGLIDLRPRSEFCQGHLHHACNLPADILADNMHLLPDNHTPLRLSGNSAELETASTFLREKGYQVVEQMLWQNSMAEVIDGRSARLWQPAPLVQQFIDEYAPRLQTQGKRGLDLACGAGRDTVYLAMNGWNMLGIDYRQDALNRVRSLAEHQSVSVNTQLCDLETGDTPFTPWEEGTFDLINVARYLHRPLFPYLKNLIAPQGILLYHTFMTGSEAFGSPKNPNFLLRQHELATYFDDWMIWQDDIISLADGRPMSYFIAQKR